MSLTNEQLQAHLKDPAVFCCRTPKGTKISAENLEDPGLFPDLVEAGLVELSDKGLTIEQVLGSTLQDDAEALVSITADMLDAVQEPAKAEVEEKPAAEEKVTMTQHPVGGSGMIRIEIGKAEKLDGLRLEVPVGGAGGVQEVFGGAGAATAIGAKKVLHTLVKKHIKITDAKIGNETSIKDGVITIDKNIIKDALKADALVKSLELDVIHPDNRHVETETIMDVVPIATKIEGKLGEGVTKIVDGCVFMLTGVDEDGVQIHEFGSSEGYLDEQMFFGHPGCADENDVIIRCHAVVERLTGMTRPGPLAAHKCQDHIIQAVRDELKEYEGEVVREELCEDVRHPGKPRILLVKEIMGQGAMHDNCLCPNEPCGVAGGRMNVDLGNVPLVLNSNEIRDGAIHALTCIGPATKEMTRHYIREPLIEGLAEDDEIDLVGVCLIGSPQVNDEKLWVSERLGSTFDSLSLDGVIITTEGFGNNHIDFVEHIGQAGSRGIPVVGVSFCAYQGQLVVGNEYADAMVEENLDAGGFENDIAGCNCITPEVAERAIQMLKNKIEGVEILPAEKKWNHEVINANNRILGLPESKLVESGTDH